MARSASAPSASANQVMPRRARRPLLRVMPFLLCSKFNNWLRLQPGRGAKITRLSTSVRSAGRIGAAEVTAAAATTGARFADAVGAVVARARARARAAGAAVTAAVAEGRFSGRGRLALDLPATGARAALVAAGAAGGATAVGAAPTAAAAAVRAAARVRVAPVVGAAAAVSIACTRIVAGPGV